MMKRILSFLLGAALIAVLVMPTVSADGNPGGWYELLSVNSVNSDGTNTFTVLQKAGSVTIPLPSRQQVRRVDILVWHTTTDYPVTAKVGSTSLTITRIDNTLSRVYGLLPSGFREEIVVNFTDNSTYNATWELLSVKLTATTTTDYAADAEFFLHDVNQAHWDAPGYEEYYGGGLFGNTPSQFGVIVNDWKKYDTISITGSVSYFALNSVRASIGNIGIPFTMSYTSTNPSYSTEDYEVWTEMEEYVMDDTVYAGTTTGTIYSYDSYDGKVMFHLTMDVSNLDRRINESFVVYFTGLFDDSFYYAVQIVGVTGAVNTADTTDVTWWQRFTSFMNDLFGADQSSGALDDLGSSSDSISQNTSQIHDFEQSQQAVLDNNFAQIQSAISFTNFAAALVFVQKYTNMTFNGISRYAIVFTLPLFLGLFFYLCSRIPGITRWKTPPPRSPSPKSKGGGKT